MKWERSTVKRFSCWVTEYWKRKDRFLFEIYIHPNPEANYDGQKPVYVLEVTILEKEHPYFPEDIFCMFFPTLRKAVSSYRSHYKHLS